MLCRITQTGGDTVIGEVLDEICHYALIEADTDYSVLEGVALPEGVSFPAAGVQRRRIVGRYKPGRFHDSLTGKKTFSGGWLLAYHESLAARLLRSNRDSPIKWSLE